MNWSMDVPTTLTSLPLYVSLAEEYMLLPHVLLPNTGSSGKNRVESDNSDPSLLDYSNNQPVITSSWDEAFHVVSIFGTENSGFEDIANILESIKQIDSYISNHSVDKKPPVKVESGGL